MQFYFVFIYFCIFFISVFFRTCRCILIFFFIFFVPAFAIKKNILILTSGYYCAQGDERATACASERAWQEIPLACKINCICENIFAFFLFRMYVCVCFSLIFFLFLAHSEFYFIVLFCIAFKLSFAAARGKLVGKLRFALAARFFPFIFYLFYSNSSS